METIEEATAAPPRLRWWKEFLLVVIFYGIYSAARNQFGSSRVDAGEPPTHAFENAVRVIDIEKFFGLYFEPALQQVFLGWSTFLRFWNIYYGTLHFAVTIGAFIWVFIRQPQRFTRWRNVLAFTTALAIVGFSLFPLMPPRLLNDGGRYGGRGLSQVAIAEGRLNPEDIDFVDTLAVHGGLWSFDSGAMKEISNQYAAMPSLHTAWAVWSALVMWPLVRRRWAKAVLIAYPVLTVYCIVVTANHFWIDGIGGLVALGIGYIAGTRLDDWNNRRLARRRATLA